MNQPEIRSRECSSAGKRALSSVRVVVTAISALLSMRECAGGTRGGAAPGFFE
ncbi:hypothetical protein [Burkholderia cepacia]|uniref:hypothetical protein n=1 Tax=Burkholderia cepacia TaxID=292 RepID=UPI001650E9C5|nr:hypothetical protein [Burkholderia cepacia]